MTPPSRAEEAHEWLKVAAEDLRLADLALVAEPPIIGLALYHAQQAAEKSLKAFLVLHGTGFPLTHDLAALLRLCLRFDAALEPQVRPALDLTDFATRYRYPGEPELPTLDESRQYLALANSVFAAVWKRVPGGERCG